MFGVDFGMKVVGRPFLRNVDLPQPANIPLIAAMTAISCLPTITDSVDSPRIISFSPFASMSNHPFVFLAIPQSVVFDGFGVSVGSGVSFPSE
jgi:hypothetical protein